MTIFSLFLFCRWKRITGVRARSQVLADSFSGLSAKPFIICLLLVILAFATTSGIAYAAAFLVHMIQLFPLSIKCYKLSQRIGLNQFSTCFHFHVTVAILLLFCNLATFPLSLHWHSIGHPPFFYTFPSAFLYSSTSGGDDFYSSNSANRKEAAKEGGEEEAGSSYYASFTDGHIIPCVLTLLCLSFVWQGKPLAVPLPRQQKKNKPVDTARLGHASCSSTRTCTCSRPSKTFPFSFFSSSTLKRGSIDTSSIPLSTISPGSRGKSKNRTRHAEPRRVSPIPVPVLPMLPLPVPLVAKTLARRILPVALYVISLSSSSLCHNVFLLPHFSALAILLFTLNGMNSLLTDSLDLARITTHHHEHRE